MVKKNKRLKNRLKKNKKGNNKNNNASKGNDVRVNKYETIKKIKGYSVPVTDWEDVVSSNLDKLIKEMKKGYDVDEDTVAVMTTNVMKRVKLYQEVASLTGVPLTRGEATWAIQYEMIYQRQLFGQDTLTEEALRDINVHNLKYIIEQTYNRNGNPHFEELKQRVYDTTDVTLLPSTEDKALLQDVYTIILEEEIKQLHKVLKG